MVDSSKLNDIDPNDIGPIEVRTTAAPPNRSSKLKSFAIPGIIIVFLGVGGFIAAASLTKNADSGEGDSSPQTTQQPEQTPEPAEDSATSEVTAAQISAGIRAKQAEFKAAGPEYPDEEKIAYEISADGTADPALHPADAELWDMMKALAPTAEVFQSITQFEVYFDEEDTTLASVESLDDTNSTWLFSINYTAVTEFSELVPTIVHEYAHILGLADDQTTTESEDSTIASSCQPLFIVEGCLMADSYLGAFFAAFWQNSGDYIGDADRDEDQATQYFIGRENDFVSEYATTNVVEDFAESFMTYTVEQPTGGTTIKARKINFFADYPTLATYRTNARTTISSWAE